MHYGSLRSLLFANKCTRLVENLWEVLIGCELTTMGPELVRNSQQRKKRTLHKVPEKLTITRFRAK